MSAPISAQQPLLINGTTDPSVTPPAGTWPVGQLYLRTTVGAAQVWQKNNTGVNDWVISGVVNTGILTISATGLTAAILNTLLTSYAHVIVGPGTINVDVSIVVPTGTTLEGAGPLTLFRATAGLGTGNPVIKSLNTIGATIKNLKVTRDLGLGGDGIEVYGDDITIKDCTIDDCIRGLRTTDRTLIDGLMSKRILIENCRAQMVTAPTALNSAFGILMSTVEDITLRECYFSNNWLDGVKGNRFVTRLKYIGGASHFNGRSSTDAGDGIDVFAGLNNTVLIDGVSFYDNGIGAIGGNGAVFKSIHDTTPATNPSNPEWGQIRGARIINCYMDNNKGSAIALEGVVDSVLGATAKLRPRGAQIHIANCVATNHFNAGIYINTFQTTISQCTLRNNGQQGIAVGPQSRDVLIDQCLFWGNGHTTVATYNQVDLLADGADAPKRVRVSNCRFNGKEATDALANTIITDADYTALTTYSKNAIHVDNLSTQVYVEDCTAEFHTQDASNFGYPVITNSTSLSGDTVTVRHKTTQGNPNARFYGGIGSIIQSQAAGGIDSGLWVKTRGAASDTNGWFNVKILQDQGIYGDGIDGHKVVAGTETLTRAMYWETLSVPVATTLITDGWPIFVRGNIGTAAVGSMSLQSAMLVAGTVKCNGADAVTTAGGVAGNTGEVPSGAAGGAGGIAAGSAGTGVTTSRRMASTGGAGGAGSGGAGGAGGTSTGFAFIEGDVRDLSTIPYGKTHTGAYAEGGPGGGGGGGDGALAGGGGGAGGGVMVICARSISNAGTISANGGAGAAGPTNNTGGGGGGGGGLILIVTGNGPPGASAGYVVEVLGGAGGASGGGAGVAGSAGVDGICIAVRA